MNLTGESFDYGPWRWLPSWDPSFTAAYFDHGGLYAFGRQPEALHWNCGQLAVALRLLADSEPLVAALERFGPLYMEAIARRWCWRLGLEPQGVEEDAKLVSICEKTMRDSGQGPDTFFFTHRSGHGRARASGELADALLGYTEIESDHDYWADAAPQSMIIEEVEAIWSAIDERDDWSPLEDKVAALRRMGEAHGAAPVPAGHK
jgi:uncharacterized protein YdiU (UPF0061 family)